MTTTHIWVVTYDNTVLLFTALDFVYRSIELSYSKREDKPRIIEETANKIVWLDHKDNKTITATYQEVYRRTEHL